MIGKPAFNVPSWIVTSAKCISDVRLRIRNRLPRAGNVAKMKPEPVRDSNAESETMQTRPLGASGFEVTCIGLGTNYVGGHGLYTAVDEAEGVRLVQRALDQGVTFIDTADIYGFGRSEELVGKAIAGRRESVFIATKGGNSFANGERTGVNNEPASLRSGLDDSLRRLGTDHCSRPCLRI